MKRYLLLLALTFSLSAFAETKHHFGWHGAPYDPTLKQFVHNPKYSTANVPDDYDLSGCMPGFTALPAAKNMPAIYDQGQEGSCTANAGIAVDEFIWHQTNAAFIGGSRQLQYTLSLIHDGNFPQDAGSTTSTVLWVLQNQGVGLESAFPYSTKLGTKPSAALLNNAATRKTLHAYAVDNTDHISIKVAISKGLPVIYGGYVYQSIETLNSSSYFNPPHKGSPIGGHERVICGYSSKLAHKVGSKTITGWYWVRNSWSTTWGMSGYCWEPAVDIENGKINEDFAVVDEVTQTSSAQ